LNTSGKVTIRQTPYHTITEVPGLRATAEQIGRIYHRYRFAADYCSGAAVFEAACGSGVGLAYLAERAKTVVGGDIDEQNLQAAQAVCRKWSDGDRLRRTFDLIRCDAHNLAFPERSFDVLILFEAIYYLREPGRFVTEAARVLKDGGVLLVCTVNKDWRDFHPSPYTYRYFGAPELKDLLGLAFPSVDLYGAFPVSQGGLYASLISIIKRAAVRLDLIPASLKMRAYLKRLFIGPLEPLPERLRDDMGPYVPPVRIPGDRDNRDYKILYAVARK